MLLGQTVLNYIFHNPFLQTEKGMLGQENWNANVM